MRRLILPALLIALLGTFAAKAVAEPSVPLQRFVQRIQQQAADHDAAAVHDHPCALAKQAALLGGAGQPSIAGLGHTHARIAEDDTTHAYNSQHLDIQLWPNIDQWTFDGEVLMTAVANQELDGFYYHLKGGVVESVEVNGFPAEYTYADDIITVVLANTIADGEEFTVRTVYNGPIYSNLFNGGLIYHPGTNTLFTFGEPYDTRRWLACYDLPFDKVTSRMRVTLEEEYSTLSNGVLTEVIDNGDGTLTYDWLNEEQTSSYLLSTASHPYLVLEDDPAGVNDVPVNYWVFPFDEDDAWADFNRTDDMIDYFEPLFGVYPFVKYDQAMAAIFSGWGAMEHQTATTYGHNLITGTRDFENIVAHELGHQWWGDYVSPRTFANIWLNEGFASYSEALWAESFGEFNRLLLLDGFRDQYFYEDNQLRYPLYNPPPERLFGTTIYKKGAWVMHMLRWVVGDDAFFDGLLQYGQAHAYQTATVPEFQSAMEDASGMDLQDFFDEWVYQAGYPEYLFSGFDVQQQTGDTWSVSFTVQQTQQDAPYFSTPLPFLFEGVNGEEELRRVDMAAEATQTVSVVGLPFEPDSFQFDPEQWILCQFENNGVQDPVVTRPAQFELTNAWPNPFNNGAAVSLTLPGPRRVTARVYDTLGREVATIADEVFEAGRHRLGWQPEPGLASGTYLLRVQAGDELRSRKLVLLR